MKFLEAIQAQIDWERARCKTLKHEFTERTPERHTIGDLIRAVMAVDNEADAKEFYRGYVEWLEAQPMDNGYTAQQVADSNIGWCFGEGMREERKRMWVMSTTASHPIFGRTSPTPEEAVRAGIRAGQKQTA
jgi:hypothetical protein